MTDNTFGFTKPNPSTAEKLRSIRPEELSSAPPPLSKVDAAGEALGFTRRGPEGQGVYRRKKDIGPTVAINTRAPERVAIPFIQFCEENRFSYWEGIEELMKRARLL